MSYVHVEKLVVAIVYVAQQLRHYLVSRKTLIVTSLDPFQYILSRCLIDIKFCFHRINLAKSKKYFVFTKLILEFPRIDQEKPSKEDILDAHLFLIDSSDPWYRSILVYLQTMWYPPNFSRKERRQLCLHENNYLFIYNTLYRQGGDCIIRLCLTREEAEKILNDCHAKEFCGHLSSLGTTQKIMHVGYFWQSIFKDCVKVVKRCHPCQIYTKKMHAHPSPLHPIVIVGPFAKWGINFMTCHPTSSSEHKYIIVDVDYLTK